jgi:protein involved in polysaccharide export with SLBB domain
MKVADLVHSYNDLLPEPSRTHAEIIRLQPPDYTPVVLAFNLGDAMDGKEQNFVLKPFDTVRVFGRFDFEDPPLVTVSGEVRDPGDHVTNGATHLRDAIYLAGGVTSEAKLDDAQIFRHTSDGEMQVISVNLAKALSGDKADDVLLEPKDRIFIHRNVDKLDPPAVSIQGEVARPGKYPLGNGMTATELVRLAGGLRRSADSQSADLTSYLQPQIKGHPSDERTIDIAKALAGAPDTDVRLHDGDVLTIPQIAGWNDRGAAVTVKGEVNRPGTYGVQEGEKLSAVLARAGGFTSSSYPYGAILERTQVRELEEKTHADLIRRVQAEGVSLKLIPDSDADQKLAKEAALLQWQATLQKLESTPPVGRMVVHISGDVSKWANTPADLQLRAGDVLTIPKHPNFVVVDGAVYNPTAITFKPGKSAQWYLQQAGGPTQMSNKKGIFVLRADGSVVGGSGGMWTGGALEAELRPGDMVIVPEKAYSGTDKWKTILQVSQLTYAIGIGIQVAKSF